MSKGELQSDPSADFAKEIAKQLPIEAAYTDIVAPAAKQSGAILSDIVKVVHLAIAPIQVLAGYQDRLRRFIDHSVRQVPEDKRVSPAPQILGPIIEGIRYEPEKTPIDEMFSELLSRSMNRDRVHEAHPAYPIIIRQLSSDEAVILRSLNRKQYNFIYTREFDHTRNLFIGPQKVEEDELPRSGLVFPDSVGFYFEHMHQLGLAGIFQNGNQEALWSEEITGKPRVQNGIRIRCLYRLTELGQRFVDACSGDATA